MPDSPYVPEIRVFEIRQATEIWVSEQTLTCLNGIVHGILPEGKGSVQLTS
jgi:hypothetical protein